MENSKLRPVNFADCYVLTNKRRESLIHLFLDTFLPNRQSAAKQYAVPQFSEQPTSTFDNEDELIMYLVQHPTEPHAIYWLNNESSTLRGAMCIFTSDGQLILGLYCETLRPDRHIEQAYLEKLMKFSESADGLIEYEQPAPENTNVFWQRLTAFKSGMDF